MSPARTRPAIEEVTILVVSDKDRVHYVIVGNIPSDDEFLSAIRPPLQPVTAALAGAIYAARALGNDSFEPMVPDRVD